jgi:predicted transposase YbfD/YdcC
MQTAEKPRIIEHFSSLTDPRILLKTRHKLIDIIVITLCAVLAGADEWTEIAEFGRIKEKWFRTFLELPFGIPSHDTFGRVFSMIRPEEFEKCFLDWVRAAFQTIAPQVIAIDGKTLRHSYDRSSNKAAIHMVSAWATENRLVLGQVKTEEKSNEITAIPELLRVLALKGCIVTIDAMGCQREIVKQIVEQGADYVISLKGNQGTLHKEVELLLQSAKENGFKDLSHDTCETTDGEHGRIEIRRFTTTGEVDWFEDKSKWEKLTSFGMVESERQIGDKTTRDTRYYISSLPSDAKTFAQASRGHWGIENGLHWSLDIAFREDESRIRIGHAATNLGIIRHFALNLIKQDKTRKIGVKGSRKRAGWDGSYLHRLLGL